MLVALALTITSIATPGWNQFKNETATNANNLNFNLNSSGLFNFACNFTNSPQSSDKNCEWKNIATWGKVVIIAICLAVLLQIAALIWNFVTFCACCCKKYIIHPLTGLAVTISICLAVAIILFWAKHESQLDINYKQFSSVKDRGEIGYSFYMACGALAGAIIDIFVGALTVCLAKHCL
uniref:Uncharacterized protein n=1 Tax=Acrobeloides nanus TaxID=290746 RepID=A0A914DLW3_9BILA